MLKVKKKFGCSQEFLFSFEFPRLTVWRPRRRRRRNRRRRRHRRHLVAS